METFFSQHHQFRRALTLDWRLHRTDLLWSVFYALIGFAFRERADASGADYVFLPFLLAAFAIGYLTFRFCALEFRPPYSDYLRNLPHDRAPTWRAHITILLVTALALDLLIGLCMLIQLNAAPGARYHATPVLFLFPFFAIAVVMLFVYASESITGLGLIMFGVSLMMILLVLGAQWLALIAGGLLIAAALLIIRREWLKPNKEALR